MKKIKFLLVLAMLTGCTLLPKKAEVKNFSLEEVKKWETTINSELEKSAAMPEWYGEDGPLLYFRKSGKMSEKQFEFFRQLSTKEITSEDIKTFNEIVAEYKEELPRTFKLKVENIKDGKALVDRLVKDAYLPLTNPALHIKKEVATTKEWLELEELAAKKDLTEDDVEDLVSLLNKFISREEFFVSTLWYNKEVSGRVNNIVELQRKVDKSKLEVNNINAKALYILYSDYLSKLDKWDE